MITQPEEELRYRRACECPEPDPVMQGDGKFYCHACSLETGARPHNLEPESYLASAHREREALMQLVEKWRKQADRNRDVADKNHDEYYVRQAYSDAMHDCADELSALLHPEGRQE